MEKPSTARVALKWGVISALISIAYSVVMILIDKYQDPSMNTPNFIFGIVVAVGVLIFAMREFRTLNDGYLSYGQGLGVGTLTSAVAGVISGIFTFIYVRFIDPTVMDKSLDRVRDEWERQGMDESAMEQAEKLTSMMMTPGALFLITVLGSLFIGFILSLIIAAVMRRDRPMFE